jgi:hypothetical protein
LAAAGLRLAEFDSVAEALEHCDNRSSGARKERVVVAGDEEGDMHGDLSSSPRKPSLGVAGTIARATKKV